MATTASDEERGVYRKYQVKRTDGSDKPGGKHQYCAYFVLDLKHDPFALAALTAYADACKKTHPELAADLYAVVETASSPTRLGPRDASEALSAALARGGV
jgi:hypothetical protein